MLKIISWNIARRELAWRSLLDSGADGALLQEATEPPSDVAQALAIDPAPWRTAGTIDRPWRTAIVRLSERADVQWLEGKSVDDAQPRELAVSRLGTLTVAVVTPTTGLPITVASMYAPWERPHGMTGSAWICADASVHRVISDLSLLIGQEQGHRLIAAGDLNILHGYGEHGNGSWLRSVGGSPLCDGDRHVNANSYSTDCHKHERRCQHWKRSFPGSLKAMRKRIG